MRFTLHQAKMQRQLHHQTLLFGFAAPCSTTTFISGWCYQYTLLTARTRTERMSLLADLRGGHTTAWYLTSNFVNRAEETYWYGHEV